VKAAAALAALLLTAACGSDPRAANNGNFQHAIDAKLARPESRLCIDVLALPHKVLVEKHLYDVQVPEGIDRDEKYIVPLEALVSAHLAKKTLTNISLTETKFNSTTFKNDNLSLSAPVAEYDATPEFSKSAVAVSSAFGSLAKLCYASLQVDRVENYSEPGSTMGETISSVYYRAKVLDVAPWANDPIMRAAFPSIQQDLEQATSGQRGAMVVLMSDGWQAQ
jgi:hypothetical protein